ncbi:unannotated protein [freshwater metagenome]|uniref:Unannotated protein n=1 Tax=freshwater metagenome TaxID=449393 RepID=A0A6J7SEG2_9ZZZZ
MEEDFFAKPEPLSAHLARQCKAGVSAGVELTAPLLADLDRLFFAQGAALIDPALGDVLTEPLTCAFNEGPSIRTHGHRASDSPTVRLV